MELEGAPGGGCGHALGSPAGGRGGPRAAGGISQPGGQARAGRARGGGGLLAGSRGAWPPWPADTSLQPSPCVTRVAGPQTILIRSGLTLAKDVAETRFPFLAKSHSGSGWRRVVKAGRCSPQRPRAAHRSGRARRPGPQSLRAQPRRPVSLPVPAHRTLGGTSSDNTEDRSSGRGPGGGLGGLGDLGDLGGLGRGPGGGLGAWGGGQGRGNRGRPGGRQRRTRRCQRTDISACRPRSWSWGARLPPEGKP